MKLQPGQLTRMNTTRAIRLSALMLAASLVPLPVSAQTWDVSRHTIDGGGGSSAAGTLSLSGTIGQTAANSFAMPMSGGSFTLAGGFWPGLGRACTLLGDMNLDGLSDAEDVQRFANCILNVNGSNCDCADFDGSGTVDAADLAQFVAALLAG